MTIVYVNVRINVCNESTCTFFRVRVFEFLCHNLVFVSAWKFVCKFLRIYFYIESFIFVKLNRFMLKTSIHFYKTARNKSYKYHFRVTRDSWRVFMISFIFFFLDVKNNLIVTISRFKVNSNIMYKRWNAHARK